MRKRKVRKGWVIAASVFLLLLFVYSRLDAWFGNVDEVDFSFSATPERILLLPGEDFYSTRTLTWRYDSILSTESYVELATEGDTSHIAASGKIIETSPNHRAGHYQAHLTQLQPNQPYSYRVVAEESASPWYNFSIPQSDTLSFLYMGDIQDSKMKDVTTRYIAQADSLFPHMDFWALGGDMIERPTDSYWSYWYRGMQRIATSTPIIAVTGNHEYLKWVPAKLDPRWCESFAYPHNGPKGQLGRSYYITIGDLCFLGIDTNGMNGIASIRDTYLWVKEVLKANDKKWIIAMHHHPVYSLSSRRHNLSSRYLLKPLYEKYGVDLVLQGHDHGYGRVATHKDGEMRSPVYVVSSCSPKCYVVSNESAFDRIGNHQKLVQHVQIVGDTLTLKTVTVEGLLYDSIQITSQGGVIDHALGWAEILEDSNLKR